MAHEAPPSMGFSRQEYWSGVPLVKEESEKVGLKLNIQKTKIMASRPITSWEIDGGKVETITDFIFLGFKITSNSDCGYKIKRQFLLGRKPRQDIKTQRHYFADKDLSSQSYDFSSSPVQTDVRDGP